MIKAVLLDLDDTLVISQTARMFPAYLEALGGYGKDLAPPEHVAGLIMESYIASLAEYAPARTLVERFFEKFLTGLNSSDESLRLFFDQFYADYYPLLVSQFVTPQPSAPETVNWLRDHGYKVVVATNPGLPEVATLQRLEQGGLSHTGFDLITTLETMHFGKPQPEYYAEILLRLDVEPGEAIMIGDDWEKDIVPALHAGLSAYWLTTEPNDGVGRSSLVDGYGSFTEFAARAKAGWLATLRPHSLGYEMYLPLMAALPAGISALIEPYAAEILECKPGDHEWSARDIICHLRDHDGEEDKIRLERILNEDRPFLSGNYDPWKHAIEYGGTPAQVALDQFVHYRGEMVRWLRGLPAEAWSRPARHAIFGPTSFEEMVRFTTEHDRTHLRQMRAAINNAVLVCGPVRPPI